ncbi:Deoxyhypusine monooxygenase [Aphelenchoides fujianensis]|nr:Deoxyhypusine monooxygenase [Aphelenchoides fujianensis]
MVVDVIPAPGSFAPEYAEGITLEYVDENGRLLNDHTRWPLAFRALFVLLRNLKCDRSVYWIGKALSDSSALLKHELAYCLGQMQNPAAIPVLIETLKDEKQEPMVRHEAGEALGAIGDPKVAGILEEYTKDSCVEVAETCILALERIRWLQEKKEDSKSSAYDSVDPTPAAEAKNAAELGRTLVDTSRSLWDRYRAMFALRNLNTPESIKALAQGRDSALFRHEVAYVLGQIQSPLTIKELSDGLRNPAENPMVRHECAEALGAIATDECEQLLQEYAKDQERVVRESCEVALDMAEYEKGDAFQYAGLSNLSWTASARPSEFTPADRGKLYKVEPAAVEALNFKKLLPVNFRKQVNTFDECVWLCRSPLLEVVNVLKKVDLKQPALRLVLWGQYGTGKSTTLSQAVHFAQQEGFVIVHVPTVMRWTRMRTPHQVSAHKAGRLDIPGLLAPFTATDCVGALFRELRRYSTLGKIKLLVALDQANSLYGKTKIKKADFTMASSDELSIVLQTRKFLRDDWTNGACVLVADKAEISDARDHLTVPLVTPRELLGEERTTRRGDRQIFYLSGFNPYHYERLCAFT